MVQIVDQHAAVNLIAEFSHRAKIDYSEKMNVAVDGGFYKGAFSRILLDRIENIQCYGFEPNEQLFNDWARIGQKNKKIELFNNALSDKTETTKLYSSSHRPATNSLLPRPSGKTTKPYYPNDAYFDNFFNVEAITLDAFCNSKGIETIFLLKLDLQGGELKALQGANTMLKFGKISIIITEAVFVEKYQCQPLLKDIWGYLSQYGYRFHSLYNLKVGDYNVSECQIRGSQFNQCDCIFVSKEMVELYD